MTNDEYDECPLNKLPTKLQFTYCIPDVDADGA